MTHTDEKLLAEQAQTDPQAFAFLYDRYFERIYRYCYRQVGEEAAAADITATTFEKALRHIRRYRWQGVSFGAWLYRIARNEAVVHFRRRRFLAPWRWLEGNGRDSLSWQLDTNPLPEMVVQARERHDLLRHALNSLAERDREILMLRFFEALSSEEVAQVLGCSTDNVYVRLHRALSRLRQVMDQAENQAEVIPYVSES